MLLTILTAYVYIFLGLMTAALCLRIVLGMIQITAESMLKEPKPSKSKPYVHIPINTYPIVLWIKSILGIM